MFDENDIYTAKNSDQCYKFIGNLGYFGNDLNDIKLAVERKSPHTLMTIKDIQKCFQASSDIRWCRNNYKMFLPFQCAR